MSDFDSITQLTDHRWQCRWKTFFRTLFISFIALSVAVGVYVSLSFAILNHMQLTEVLNELSNMDMERSPNMEHHQMKLPNGGKVMNFSCLKETPINFVVGGVSEPFFILDKASGHLQGFFIDLAELVCREANEELRTISNETNYKCSFTFSQEEQLCSELNEQKKNYDYDGCLLYYHSHVRFMKNHTRRCATMKPVELTHPITASLWTMRSIFNDMRKTLTIGLLKSQMCNEFELVEKILNSGTKGVQMTQTKFIQFDNFHDIVDAFYSGNLTHVCLYNTLDDRFKLMKDERFLLIAQTISTRLSSNDKMFSKNRLGLLLFHRKSICRSTKHLRDKFMLQFHLLLKRTMKNINVVRKLCIRYRIPGEICPAQKKKSRRLTGLQSTLYTPNKHRNDLYRN
ncbi:hypothetical protein SNEBB_010418 [Seison nebaliae]|nr:hypothetical protein SNEBB_010418 [Seison nebaliae]